MVLELALAFTTTVLLLVLTVVTYLSVSTKYVRTLHYRRSAFVPWLRLPGFRLNAQTAFLSPSILQV